MSEEYGTDERVAELEARLAFFERAQAASGVGSWRTDVGPENVLELSDEAYRILGIPAGTPVRNIDFFQMMHPEDRERLVETIIVVRAQRVRRELELRVIRPDGEARVVHLSAGPASSAESDTAVLGSLADVTGRRRQLHDPASLQRLQAEQELRDALRQGELFLEYQPIVSLVTGEYVGAEALVRWNHPLRGRVEPTEFVSLAEESGLIYELGAWVLSTACSVLRGWIDAGLPEDFVMCVNLSAVQLRAERLPAAIKEAIARSGVQGPNVVLEVTESVLVEGSLDEQSLRLIRDLGVHVAIDDFGTKYSSLGYLPRLPVDALKVDAVFVQATDDPAGQAVVNAIAALGEALGLTVTAEGIETQEQLAAAYRAGCDAVQGFFIAPPLSAEDCLRLAQSPGPLVI